MSWLTEGPLAGLLHRGGDNAATTGGATRSSPFSGAGPVQRGFNALSDWIGSRGLGDPGGMSTNQAGRAGVELDARTDWNPGGTLGQIAPDPGASAGGPAWYDNVTTNADDPMGLVPDYGQDGAPAETEGGAPQQSYAHGEKGFAGAMAAFGSGFSPGQVVYTGHTDQWYNGPNKRRSK